MITINNKEYEFKYTFSKLNKLMQAKNLTLEGLSELGKDFSSVALIGAIGMNKTEQELEQLLDESTFEAVKTIMEAFAKEVQAYFPNVESQTP